MLLPVEIAQSTEVMIRLGCFVGIIGILATLEANFPRRHRRIARAQRWPSNLAVSALNQIFTRLILPVSAIALAMEAQANDWGILGQISLAHSVKIFAAILILDLAIYLQHVVFHAVPILWRFHQMHHADMEVDVTTGVRFHPLSVLLSGAIKLAVVLVIGAPPAAVLAFEILLNASSLFNHSNIRIPAAIERTLRLVIVTPDMHRVHHSSDARETNRNFGFNFPWWDRLFHTYTAQPAGGHASMVLGVERFRQMKELRLDRMLSQPFRNESDS